MQWCNNFDYDHLTDYIYQHVLVHVWVIQLHRADEPQAGRNNCLIYTHATKCCYLLCHAHVAMPRLPTISTYINYNLSHILSKIFTNVKVINHHILLGRWWYIIAMA